jgi:hypothetical protein
MPVTLEEEGEPEAAAPGLQRYLTEVPIIRPYVDVRPDSPLNTLVAGALRHPVFRIVGHTSECLTADLAA